MSRSMLVIYAEDRINALDHGDSNHKLRDTQTHSQSLNSKYPFRQPTFSRSMHHCWTMLTGAYEEEQICEFAPTGSHFPVSNLFLIGISPESPMVTALLLSESSVLRGSPKLPFRAMLTLLVISYVAHIAFVVAIVVGGERSCMMSWTPSSLVFPLRVCGPCSRTARVVRGRREIGRCKAGEE